MLDSTEVRSYFKNVVKIKVNPEDSEAGEKLAREFGVQGYPIFSSIRKTVALSASIGASR